MHVLFVDDDPVNRRLGARMLGRLGCTFVMLEDGDQVTLCSVVAITCGNPCALTTVCVPRVAGALRAGHLPQD